jgi:hypothetical protein
VSEPIYNPFEYFFGCKRFALWHRHRLPSSFKAVDIDLVGTERGRIAYVIESTSGTLDGKSCSVTRGIAEAVGARGLVVGIPKFKTPPDDWVPWRQVSDYILHSEPPETISVRQVYPPPGWQKNLSWTEFQGLLAECRDEVS